MVSKLLESKLSRALLIFFAMVLSLTALAFLLRPVLIPLAISLLIYVILKPLTFKLVRNGWSRAQASAFLTLLLLILFIIWSAIILPELISNLAGLKDDIQRLSSLLAVMLVDAQQWFEKWGVRLDTQKIEQLLTSQSPAINTDQLLQGGNYLVTMSTVVVLVPFITFFLIRDFPSLRSRVLNLLPNRYFELAWLIYFRVTRQLQGYLRGLFIQQTVMAMVSATGFWLLGFPAPILLGALVGLFGIIPYLGPALGLLPPALIVLSEQPDNYILLVYAVLIIVVAYMVDNFIVVPTVIAQVVALHPLLVILAVIIFGNLFGVVGMVLAIPATVSAKLIVGGLMNGLAAK